MAAPVSILLTWLSIARYAGYNTAMFDLGNMAQAIWSVTQGQPLLYTRPEGSNASRLAGHVELIYGLLALPYAIWPDPRLLLGIQAILFALGALPVYWIVMRRIGSRYAARCLALIYLLYPTAQTSVLFDLHGDTLALPLLMFALDALDARAWWRYGVFVALVLACKFYMAVPVIGIGVYVFVWGGQRRAGVLTMIAGMVYGLVMVVLVRPVFLSSEAGVSGITAAGTITRNYLGYYFGQIDQIGVTLDQRLLSAIIVFGPALFVAWRGWRWLLVGLPLAIAALISTGPGGAYDYRYHHYAAVVPFIMMAAIDGTARLKAARESARRRGGRTWSGDLGMTLAIVVIFAVLLVNTPLNPLSWLRVPGYGLDPSAYGVIDRDAFKDRFLAESIPPRAPLAASNFLATRLVNREKVYLLRYPDESEGPRRLPSLLPQVDYAAADALFDFYLPLDEGYAGGLDGDRDAIGVLLQHPEFGLVAARDGLLVFQRGAAPERTLANSIDMRSDDGAPPEQTYGTQIALVHHSIIQSGPGHLRASFTWRRTGDLTGRFVAVSRLEGIAEARIVHLPTYVLRPPETWQSGDLVVETFEIELPPEVAPGTYVWRTGWYNVGLPASYLTDSRSLLPGSQEVVLGSVEVR